MTFEEWMKAKQEEDKIITHGAEPVTGPRLYSLESAVINACFDGDLPIMNLYYIPKDLDRGSVGMYGYQRIMISKPYYEEHGVDAALISVMFHELCHAWDAQQGAKDTEGDYHTAQFKQTAEEHGGIARFSDAQYGFNDVKPDEEHMQRIKAKLKKENALQN